MSDDIAKQFGLAIARGLAIQRQLAATKSSSRIIPPEIKAMTTDELATLWASGSEYAESWCDEIWHELAINRKRGDLCPI